MCDLERKLPADLLGRSLKIWGEALPRVLTARRKVLVPGESLAADLEACLEQEKGLFEMSPEVVDGIYQPRLNREVRWRFELRGHDAEEVIQDALLKVGRRFRRARGQILPQSRLPWAYWAYFIHFRKRDDGSTRLGGALFSALMDWLERPGRDASRRVREDMQRVVGELAGLQLKLESLLVELIHACPEAPGGRRPGMRRLAVSLVEGGFVLRDADVLSLFQLPESFVSNFRARQFVDFGAFFEEDPRYRQLREDIERVETEKRELLAFARETRELRRKLREAERDLRSLRGDREATDDQIARAEAACADLRDRLTPHEVHWEEQTDWPRPAAEDEEQDIDFDDGEALPEDQP